jgi:amino acid adenylation domain-containing protein
MENKATLTLHLDTDHWSNAYVDGPKTRREWRGIGDLFVEQVRRTPELPAVVERDRRWTYSELLRHAQSCAQRLRERGVQRGELVAVLGRRSAELIGSLFGVLEAGGAYLPIDPHTPRLRVELLLREANVRFVLTHSSDLGNLPAADVEPIFVDSPIVRSRRRDRFAGKSAGSPDDLAYAIWTSGSTGGPKGVLLAHRGVANLVPSQRRMFGIRPGRRVLQFASLSFDASVSEIFVTLLSGATLCLAEPLALAPGEELARTLNQMRINVVTLPPSIVATLGNEKFSHLRTLVVAGEACPAQLAARWSKGRRMVNAYGPTESTVCATMYRIPAGLPEAPPIGRPIDNCELLILDDQGQPVPAGQTGELYIGGPGVAQGYLNRPDLTSERFVRFAHRQLLTGRFYRTGDLVRLRSDDNLEFLGRVDHEIKIHGVRIDPGEIVATLEEHPAVRQAAVLSFQVDGGAEKRLGACIVQHARPALSTTELRRWLSQRLPSHLVPSTIVPIAELPLNDNGKMDRPALVSCLQREANISRSPNSVTSVCRPRRSTARANSFDPLERELARMWQEIFPERTFGSRSDFFQLGGDSLLAMEFLARLERRYRVPFSLGDLMEGPTIHELAQRIHRRERLAHDSLIVRFNSGGSAAPLVSVHPGGGSVFCYRELARHLGPDQPLWAIQSPPSAALTGQLATLEGLAAHYASKLKELDPGGPFRLSGWSFGGVVAFEMARLLHSQGHRVDLVCVMDAGFLYHFAVLRKVFANDKLGLFGLLRLPQEEQLRHFRQRAEQARVFPLGLNDDQLREILGVFIANVRAMTAFRPRPFAGNITLMLAHERLVRARCEPYEEWKPLCRQIDIVPVPGSHLTMLAEPHVGVLAKRLRQLLSRWASQQFRPRETLIA